jgi:hypothetical protein
MKHGTAGITKNGIHAFTLQTFNKYFGTGHFHFLLHSPELLKAPRR